MKAVAFNGSPRSGGNTELLLNRVLEPIQDAGIETELIQIGGRPIRGCTACRKCFENQDNRCIIDNDLVNGYIAKMIEADAIILGSPTYFAGVSPEIKALIDRAGYVAFANGRLFSRKVGAGVVAVRRGGGVPVLDCMNHLFLMSRMIVPGSTYWNLGFGLDKGEVEQDSEGLANMKDLGEQIAWLLKKIAG